MANAILPKNTILTKNKSSSELLYLTAVLCEVLSEIEKKWEFSGRYGDEKIRDPQVKYAFCIKDKMMHCLQQFMCQKNT